MRADGHLGVQDVFTAKREWIRSLSEIEEGCPYATLTYARTYHMVTLGGKVKGKDVCTSK